MREEVDLVQIGVVSDHNEKEVVRIGDGKVRLAVISAQIRNHKREFAREVLQWKLSIINHHLYIGVDGYLFHFGDFVL